MIEPHGGTLVDRVLSPDESEKIRRGAEDLFVLELDDAQIKDLKNIARGVYSPLEGFLREEDFRRVVSEMRLTNGIVWPIPVVLDISKEVYRDIKRESQIGLADNQGDLVALLKDFQVYSYDKDFFAENVFGTRDRDHPGVEGVYKRGEYLIGGDVWLFDEVEDLFLEYNFSPRRTREIFNHRGWKSVVAFQTRNVPHRGHEFLQKSALEIVDGLFVHPVIGQKKLGDFKDEYILSGYEMLIDKYFPRNRVVLGVLPLKMCYAGPREALFHALIRKNFGCSHFIVGRDHAGVGDYYDPFGAQKIFEQFNKDEVGVEILKFGEVVFNSSAGRHCFVGDCPEDSAVSFSGSVVREYIEEKKQPPSYIMRPEVFKILTNSNNTLVDGMYHNSAFKNRTGFVLWFTGLSSSGKSTIADAVYDALRTRKVKVERLDGDVVRESLTKDLGFTKEDRDENIRRVGFVSRLLSRNGVGVVASFISPYEEEREGVRMKVENFVEIFVNTPLEVCEERDRKGLYAKARRGEIDNFTGISAPYEEPESPDIELKTDEESVEDCVKKVTDYLEERGFIE